MLGDSDRDIHKNIVGFFRTAERRRPVDNMRSAECQRRIKRYTTTVTHYIIHCVLPPGCQPAVHSPFGVVSFSSKACLSIMNWSINTDNHVLAPLPFSLICLQCDKVDFLQSGSARARCPRTFVMHAVALCSNSGCQCSLTEKDQKIKPDVLQIWAARTHRKSCSIVSSSLSRACRISWTPLNAANKEPLPFSKPLL